MHGKAKKEKNYKEEGNIYTTRKTRWRKVEGERKRLEEKEVAGEKSRKRGNEGGGLTVRSETLAVSRPRSPGFGALLCCSGLEAPKRRWNTGLSVPSNLPLVIHRVMIRF